MKNQMKLLTLLLSLGFLFFSFNHISQITDDWDVPDKYKKMVNPTKADKEGMAIAKQLYSKHCKSCHGKEGLGDGPKADELDTPSGDFSSEEFHAQSDGEMFYKSKFGRDDMPEFTKKLPDDEDMWLLVHYMRTFEE